MPDYIIVLLSYLLAFPVQLPQYMEANVTKTYSVIRHSVKKAVPVWTEHARARKIIISETAFAGRREVSNFNTNY
jgi:hypothetical protein